MPDKRSSVKTSILLQKLLKTNDLDQFLEKNKEAFDRTELAAYFDALCNQQGMTKESVFAQAEIDRSFGYQMLRGVRSISRDNVLRLAIALRLSPEQTDDFLKRTRKASLYARINRDAIIIFALEHQLSLDKVQSELRRNQITILGGGRHEI